MTHRLFCLVLLAAVVVGRAQEQVRSTQEELRRRNIFFGDIDGRRSGEYTEAVRRYQQRKGLPASGQEDHDTLRSLGLVARSANEPVPKELEWPAEPILKSDTRLDVAVAAKQLSAETGVAPSEITAVGNGPRKEASRGRVSTLRLSNEQFVEAAPKSSGRSSATRLSFLRKESIPSEVTDYAAEYVRAVGHNRLEDELHFYADHVDYFGHGNVDRRIIEQTLRKYYQRWPSRSYSLVGPVRYHLDQTRGEIVLSFRVNFALKNGHTQVKGQTENRVTINAATADPRIVAIEEQRVRN